MSLFRCITFLVCVSTQRGDNCFFGKEARFGNSQNRLCAAGNQLFSAESLPNYCNYMLIFIYKSPKRVEILFTPFQLNYFSSLCERLFSQIHLSEQGQTRFHHVHFTKRTLALQPRDTHLLDGRCNNYLITRKFNFGPAHSTCFTKK